MLLIVEYCLNIGASLLGEHPPPPSPSSLPRPATSHFVLYWASSYKVRVLAEAADTPAETFCSHLDRDGDGYISVGEVAILLEELGIDVGQQGQGQDLGQVSVEGAGHKLLGALANKEPSRVNFEEFMQFNSQVRPATAPCAPCCSAGIPSRMHNWVLSPSAAAFEPIDRFTSSLQTSVIAFQQIKFMPRNTEVS